MNISTDQGPRPHSAMRRAAASSGETRLSEIRSSALVLTALEIVLIVFILAPESPALRKAVSETFITASDVILPPHACLIRTKRLAAAAVPNCCETTIETSVEAALSGTVFATGNTDLVQGCYSFGKWVMIQHGNGISTLYAHLSQIDVSQGQSVSIGQTIGLSGMTGYATGPHLHFGVYATEGVKIMTLRQFRGATIGCADATMPVATLDAYLNPLSYL